MTLVAALLFMLTWAPLEGHEADSVVIKVLEPEQVSASELTVIAASLVLPAQAKANQALKGELRVENIGQLPCQVPATLQPCSGSVRFDWRGPDGKSHSRCSLAPQTSDQNINLVPAGFYGQRFSLDTTEPPCRRIASPSVCDWPPGRYIFKATIMIPGDPSVGRPERRVSTDSVMVVIKQ